MTNRVVTFLGAAAVVAQCAFLLGCSSGGGTTPGTGGSAATTGTGGAGGASSGGGGSGSGMCSAVNTEPKMGPACDVKNKSACDMDKITGTADDAACYTTCGPNKAGTKNCSCVAGVWSCPNCSYDLSNPGAFDCFKTDAATTCPADPTDTSGAMLPASGGLCTLPPCKPCGSAIANSYRDSGGTPKMGWCICVPKTDGSGTSQYSCASVKEWAPQCHS